MRKNGTGRPLDNSLSGDEPRLEGHLLRAEGRLGEAREAYERTREAYVEGRRLRQGSDGVATASGVGRSRMRYQEDAAGEPAVGRCRGCSGLPSIGRWARSFTLVAGVGRISPPN